MPDAPEVKVKLTAEDAGVSAAIKELGNQLKNLKQRSDEAAGSGLSLKRAFEGIAAAGAVLGLEEIGRKAFDSAVSIGRMADKTGITTQTLSVFHHVAEETGTSTEAVDKALTKAAKSITQFEQGSKQAAAGFKLLGITQKDFQGLKPDEKIALVTTRLGGMAAGFQKATAAQLIFSKGGAEFIPVANALAGEGFDKVTESVSKLGLLLDQKTTDDFRSAKASIQELEDVGQGMATQFEAGLLPAISDVGEALVDSLTQGGVSFKDIGSVAGTVVRGISGVFLGLGQALGSIAFSIYDAFASYFKLVYADGKATFEALGEVVKGNFSGALASVRQAVDAERGRVREAIDRQKAIYAALATQFKSDYDNLFPSAEEEEKRRKARIARLRPDKQKPEGDTKPDTGPTDAAARAALALLERHLQDELLITRAGAKLTEATDKDKYDRGLLSLSEYFQKRKDAVTSETDQEVEILRAGLAAAVNEQQKAEAAKANAETPKDADKQDAIRLQAMAKIEELQTKIREAEINAKTKTQGLDAQEFKERESNQQKILEFHKLVDVAEGNSLEAVKKEIEIEKQKLAIILAQAGESQQAIDAELARYEAVKTAEAQLAETRKGGEAQLKLLADQRSEIEDKVKTGQLFQAQGEEQIRQIELARLPVLRQIAAAQLEQAQKSGDQTKVAQAEDFQRQVNQIGVNANTVGQQVAALKQNLQSSLTSGFAGFFTSLANGTATVGQAFRALASTVVSSLAQMAAQLIAQIILTKLLKTALTGFSGGGVVGGGGGGGGGGHAAGGLIRGPGGPKADAIPARLSDGEYVVKAEAVERFGVGNLEAINRGVKIPGIQQVGLPKFSEGGLVGNPGGGGGSASDIRLGIGLEEGLVLRHFSSKAAGKIVLQHLADNPKAAGKALSRSD